MLLSLSYLSSNILGVNLFENHISDKKYFLILLCIKRQIKWEKLITV